MTGGQCRLIHLTILRRFSWHSLAYICTKVPPFISFSFLSLRSAAGQFLVNQIAQWHVVLKQIMLVVTTDGHRGGNSIDTRDVRDSAEAHLSNQLYASDSDDTEPTLAVKKRRVMIYTFVVRQHPPFSSRHVAIGMT